MIPLRQEELTARQQRFLLAVLDCETLREAERKTGICHRTAFRWYHSDHFQAELKAAQRRVYGQALGRLQVAALKAVNYLVGALDESSKPDGVKVRAAAVLLGNALGAHAIEELQSKITALEAVVYNEQQGQRRSA